MIIISSISLIAGNCSFEEEMEESTRLYMMFLLYFRTYDCSDDFEWKKLKVNNTKKLDILNFMPQENSATRRTESLSISYLILNILLLLSSFSLLCKFSSFQN